MLIETVLLGLLFLGGPLSIWYYGKRKNIGNINVKKNVKSSQVSTTKNWPLIINSAMLYALAYTVVYFIQEVLLTIPKVMYGLNATLLHNNATWEISHPQQDLLQSSGALGLTVIGLILLASYKYQKSDHPMLRLFHLWLIYHFLAQAIPQYSGLIYGPESDFGRALVYLETPLLIGWVLTVLAFATMILFGLFLTKPFLEFAAKQNLATVRDRHQFLLQFVFIAPLIGYLIIIPFKVPGMEQILSPFQLSFLPSLYILANSWRVDKAEVSVGRNNNKLDVIGKGIIVALLVWLSFFQLVLARGVKFF